MLLYYKFYVQSTYNSHNSCALELNVRRIICPLKATGAVLTGNKVACEVRE
jgi:hypothetical protein